jgi:hypothetical protein
MQFRYFPGSRIAFAAIPLLFLSSLCQAATVPATPAPNSPQAIQEYVQTQLAIWKLRLDLMDWRVSLVFCHPPQLGPKKMGDVEWDQTAKTAVIRVMDPADYRLSPEDTRKDMEFTVLHGLIHLELASLPRNKRNAEREELAVSQLADALLRLDRGTK